MTGMIIIGVCLFFGFLLLVVRITGGWRNIDGNGQQNGGAKDDQTTSPSQTPPASAPKVLKVFGKAIRIAWVIRMLVVLIMAASGGYLVHENLPLLKNTGSGTISKSEEKAEPTKLSLDEKGEARIAQFENSWAVRCPPSGDWFGPVVVPKGKYLLTMVEKDVIIEVMVGDEKFSLKREEGKKRGKQEVEVSQDFSPIKFRCPKGKWGTVTVKINHIG